MSDALLREMIKSKVRGYSLAVELLKARKEIRRLKKDLAQTQSMAWDEGHW
jgi:hypothetical protein